MRARPLDQKPSATWQPLGPIGVISAGYGLVTGRISALALDPSDLTGNTLFAGTTGGGVWHSSNAGAASASVAFTPLTDSVGALSGGAVDPSISIGAITVQPGGTGVVLAGTGDPNDALDSYYGSGILRSPDSGKSWTLIQQTADLRFAFVGEGIAGFAWSTLSPQTVVAAVSQAAEGLLVDADAAGVSYEGLYYSTDGGSTWSLAQITDLNGQDVQGPLDPFAGSDGNAATAVVWNRMRGMFIAAVRFHGYYESPDGIRWTRLASQPGSGLTTALCPTNAGSTGSPYCPIFRGALAVNPQTGDTFAWSVDQNNQDQGIWQDACAASGNACTNPTITFGKQWNSAALEIDIPNQGAATINNGDYNLVLAALPSSQDTLLLAGANDLWKCSLAAGCAWRNTTNATTCMSAQVAGYQHALAWDAQNPQEVFIGNDSGLWRSVDAIGETGTACSTNDASHFQNLNGALGSLAEAESMSPVGATPYTMMVGLGANGTAGVKSTTGLTTDWPQILTGEGGPVAVDPTNANNWYVNNGAGVSIHLCAQTALCTAADFGTALEVSNADVNGDGLTMTVPAPFLVDPVDATQLLIGTCRVWRGPANGVGWSTANAISSMLDGAKGSPACNGNALIRSITALPLAGGGEVVYVGTYGQLNGGATLPGHVLKATMSSAGTWSSWHDLTLNPVSNDAFAMNAYGLDISSLFIDPIDGSGNTIYATIAGVPSTAQDVKVAYRSTDGGAHWTAIASNLPFAPANGMVVDPQDSNTVYIATDVGVFSTRAINTCASAACWSAYGSGLPESPVVALSAAPVGASLSVLAAATYGRGVWQIPLQGAPAQLTTAIVAPTSLGFGTQAYGVPSAAQMVTLTNTGGIALATATVETTGDFTETDNCANATVAAGASCSIQVTFTPSAAGPRDGQLTITGNLSAQLVVQLSGTGTSPGAVALVPATVNFGSVQVGSTSGSLQVTAENSRGAAVPITSIKVSGPFVLASNACGTTSLAANTDCQLELEFAPTAAGAATGALTLVDGAGTQTTQLTGTGLSVATDTLSPSSLAFAGTIIGQLSPAQTVTLTNSGGVPLTGIAVSASGPFQQSNNCTTQLAGPASCAISVVFDPTATGQAGGTLTVSDILRTQAQTVPLAGTGVATPVLTVSPTALSFSGQQVGVASAPVALNVANSGGVAVANVSLAITGPGASSFSMGTTTCGASLAANSSCAFPVTFTPSATGSAVATGTITTATGGVKPVTVSISGTGQAATGLSASPTQLTFAAEAVGQTSAAQTVTVTNNSGVTAIGLNLAVSGPFTLTQNTCGTSLAAGANCTTGVVFVPASTGGLSGSLTVNSTSVTTPATVALSGIGGLAAAVQISPMLLTFPTTGVGKASSAMTVTVSNSGSTALTNMALSVTSGFQLTANTCAATLAAGANCTTGVTFAPTSVGEQTGSLTVASSALATSATAQMTGVGFDFTATAGTTASQTVASGQTASFTLTLTPASGLSGAFSFQCGTLPTYAACTFSPAMETVSANSTGTDILEVATSQTTASLQRPADSPGFASLPIFCVLLLTPWAWRRKRALGLMLLLILLVSGVSSCASSGGGGGSNSPPLSKTTPAGTYSIPVTVSSNGVSHVVTLTLVVD
jgi:hypothetical protein